MYAKLAKNYRPPPKIIKTHFRKKEYISTIPDKGKLLVKQYVANLSNNDFNEKRNYKDYEIYKNDQLLSFQYNILSDDLTQPFKVFRSEFTKKNYLSRMNRESYQLYDFVDDTGKSRSYKKEGELEPVQINFFMYLLNSTKTQQFKFNEDITKKLQKIPDLLTEGVLTKNKQWYNSFSSRWTYNRHSFNAVNSFNLQKVDLDSYKSFMIQLFAMMVEESQGSLKLDIDYKLSGLETNEFNNDLAIMTNDKTFLLPISIIHPLSEVKIYEKLRVGLYALNFPSFAPDILFEFMNRNKFVKLSIKEKQTVDEVNRHIGILIYFKLFLAPEIQKHLDSARFQHFEDYSFVNYNLLKVLSKCRFNMSKKVHVGLSLDNDKLRFNLYRRSNHWGIENTFSISRSEVFNLRINPGDKTKQFHHGHLKTIFDIINIVKNLSGEELDNMYEEYVYDLKYKHHLVDNEEIDKDLENKTQQNVLYQEYIEKRNEEINNEIEEMKKNIPTN